MCIYYYLHYHHVAPCNKEIEYEVRYTFCANSTMEPLMESPVSTHHHHHPSSSTSGGGEYQLVQQPCEYLTQAPEYDPAFGFDYTNPCATGGCLESQHCASGGCRLDELGGRWVCCRCSRGGNTFKWCVHPRRKVPDALCYHVVCRNCQMDA
ncbi:hypothetical protein F4801DRAFT_578744 [Xylaria longipes]|nr:hypothetical protein F4801DRAFT_578744 [Xylaria longipes]RYC63135.1 hypothetical protein CHU98_g3093 [Xylaria longipes]